MIIGLYKKQKNIHPNKRIGRTFIIGNLYLLLDTVPYKQKNCLYSEEAVLRLSFVGFKFDPDLFFVLIDHITSLIIYDVPNRKIKTVWLFDWCMDQKHCVIYKMWQRSGETKTQQTFIRSRKEEGPPPHLYVTFCSDLPQKWVLIVWWWDTHENVALPPYDGNIFFFVIIFFFPYFLLKSWFISFVGHIYIFGRNLTHKRN